MLTGLTLLLLPRLCLGLGLEKGQGSSAPVPPHSSPQSVLFISSLSYCVIVKIMCSGNRLDQIKKNFF